MFSVGQELESSLAGWLWLGVSLEAAVKMSTGNCLGLENSLPRWLVHMAGKLVLGIGRAQFHPRHPGKESAYLTLYSRSDKVDKQ